jgi:hypothetical protein
MAKKGVVNKKNLKNDDDRPVRWRKYPHLFLIVCEDQNTEPDYFERFRDQFPEETVFLRTVGVGRSALGVVEQCIREREKLADESNKTVDETWSVFDKDDADRVPANAVRFGNAFELAKREGISVACSNEVFELWLLLHLVDVDPANAIPRQQIYARLEGAIRAFPGYQTFQYQHRNTNVIDATLAYGDESLAVLRSTRLLAYHVGLGRTPIQSNPSTTMHLLVARLRELINWYAYTPE